MHASRVSMDPTVCTLTHGAVLQKGDHFSTGIVEHVQGMNPRLSAEGEERGLLIMLELHNDTDVVLFIKRAYNRSVNATLIAEIASALEFAPQLFHQSDQLASQLGKPLVAVHFRFEHLVMQVSGIWVGGANENETVAIVRMHMCSNGAVHMAKKVMHIKYKAHVLVFIASDLDFRIEGKNDTKKKGGVFNSDTLAVLGKDVAQAMKQATKRVHLQLPGTHVEMLDPTLANADSAVKAILDKLMCSKAAHLIVGDLSCGGLGSYEVAIMHHRKLNGLEEAKSVHRFKIV